MTLLYVTASLGGGGPGTIAANALEAMRDWVDAKPPRATLIAPSADLTSSPVRDAVMDRLAPLYVRDGVTVLHAFNNVAFSAMVVARELARPPKVVVERASTHPDHQRRVLAYERKRFNVQPDPYDDAQHERMKWEIRHADVIVTPSEQAAETIRAVFEAEERDRDWVAVRVIQFGSDPETFTPADDEDKPAGFWVLYLGAPWMRKGFWHLEQAFLKAYEDRRDTGWRLTANVPGDIPRPQAPPGIRIVHGGAIDERTKAQTYRKHHVFALPSFEEGQAIAIWEALASGLPVVCTRECGHPMIEEAKAGTFVRPGDVQGIADALSWYADNPSEIRAQGRNARKLALTRTWADYRRDLRRMWEELGA